MNNPAKGYIIMWREQDSQYQRAVFIDALDRKSVKLIAASLASEDGITNAVIYETVDHWRVLFDHKGNEVADKGAA